MSITTTRVRLIGDDDDGDHDNQESILLKWSTTASACLLACLNPSTFCTHFRLCCLFILFYIGYLCLRVAAQLINSSPSQPAIHHPLKWLCLLSSCHVIRPGERASISVPSNSQQLLLLFTTCTFLFSATHNRQGTTLLHFSTSSTIIIDISMIVIVIIIVIRILALSWFGRALWNESHVSATVKRFWFLQFSQSSCLSLLYICHIFSQVFIHTNTSFRRT